MRAGTALRAVNNMQRLYYAHPSSPGSAFFLPRGARLIGKLERFMRQQLRIHGYEEVITPQLFKQSLWEQSGHWQHYKEDMFGVTGAKGGAGEYSLKPMNCPAHCLIFQSQERSFRNLPLRLADFSPLHRNEATGALSGLTRVRKFHQDDGHIFCASNQVSEEIYKALKLVSSVYSVFDLPYSLALSTRPAEFIGSKAEWDDAENQLRQAMESNGSQDVQLKVGDGAFYGPKIDVSVYDSQNKQHQTSTLQLDFQLPKQFDLKFSNANQELERPVLIHRAVFGSFERFLALLFSHYNGKWPFWLNPVQAVVLPVSDKHAEFAKKVALTLRNFPTQDNKPVPLNLETFDVEVFDQSESLNRRIRHARDENASYIVVVGDEEVEKGTISVRERGTKSAVSMQPSDLVAKFHKLTETYS